MLLAALSLSQRELVRFLRQRSRVVGALAPPLLFWFLIGSGLGDSFRPQNAPGSMNSLEYLFPGTLLLILLFTAIFSTISIIEDRREGFLQSVLVAPRSHVALVLGKMLGATALAVAQVLLVLLMTPLLGIRMGPDAVGVTLLTLCIVAFGFTGLGFVIAWQLDSTQGFHAVMNLLLMPMWILSGALFPPHGAPAWLRGVMLANPMSHALDSMRHALYFGTGVDAWGTQTHSVLQSLGISTAFATLMFAGAMWLAGRPAKRHFT